MIQSPLPRLSAVGELGLDGVASSSVPLVPATEAGAPADSGAGGSAGQDADPVAALGAGVEEGFVQSRVHRGGHVASPGREIPTNETAAAGQRRRHDDLVHEDPVVGEGEVKGLGRSPRQEPRRRNRREARRSMRPIAPRERSAGRTRAPRLPRSRLPQGREPREGKAVVLRRFPMDPWTVGSRLVQAHLGPARARPEKFSAARGKNLFCQGENSLTVPIISGPATAQVRHFARIDPI